MKTNYIWIIFIIILVGITGFLPVGLSSAQITYNVTVVQWSPDGSMIAGGDNAGFLHIWDSVTGKTLFEFQAHSSNITALSWKPDGTRVLSASPSDGLIRIWNTGDGQLMGELQGDPAFDGPLFAAWNPKGNMIVGVTFRIDGALPLRFWSADNDLYELLPFGYGVSAFNIAWSPDGSILAVADYRAIYVFDDFSPNMEPRSLAPFASSVTWSPDGSKLAAVDIPQGKVQLLDVVSGQNLVTLQDVQQSIVSLVWSPDGERFATDTFDGTTQIWNSMSGELIETISLNRQGGIGILSWSPYGGRLAFGNASSDTLHTDDSIDGDVTVSLNIANGAVQIVVPVPSLELLDTIAKECNTSPEVEQSLTASIASNQLQALTSTVESLTAEQIPSACAADLIAVAQALQAG